MKFRFDNIHKVTFQVAFGFFLIAALLGSIMRLIYICDVPFLDYMHLLHTHSHLAMLGWGFTALAGALVFIIVPEQSTNKHFKNTIVVNTIAGIGMLSIKKELSEFLMLHLDSTEEEMITARLSFKTISISTDDYLSLLESLKKIIYPSLATSFYSDKEKMRQADPNLDSLHGGLFLNKYHKWTHIYGNRYSGLIRRDTIISYDSTYIEYKRVNKKATYSDSDKTTTFTTVIDTVSLRFNEIQNGVYACYYDISKSLIDTSSWSGYPYKQRDTLRSLYSILSSDVSFEYINIYDLPNQFAFTTYRNPSFSSADAKSHFIKTMSTNFHKSLIRTYDIPHILLEVKLKNKPILSVMLPSDQKRRLLLQLE